MDAGSKVPPFVMTLQCEVLGRLELGSICLQIMGRLNWIVCSGAGSCPLHGTALCLLMIIVVTVPNLASSRSVEVWCLLVSISRMVVFLVTSCRNLTAVAFL